MGLSSGQTDGMLTDTVVNEQLQFAINDIASERDWPWLQTSASLSFSSGTAAFPTGMVKLIDISYLGKRLNRLSISEALEQTTPYAGYYIYSDQLVTYPSGQTLTPCIATYIVQETDLDGDSDVPRLPLQHHQVWVNRAAWYCASIRRDAQMKSELEQEYRDGVRRMLDDVNRYAGQRQIRSIRNRRI
jgi:hypothetical protein